MGAVVVAAAVACSSPPAPTPAPSVAENPSATTASTSTPGGKAGTVIPISIAAGSVDPTNADVDATAGTPIVLEVSSDAPDSIHVHSVPEHVFDVQARPGQRFEFTVDVPGRVDVELHELNRTIVTITVKPG